MIGLSNIQTFVKYNAVQPMITQYAPGTRLGLLVRLYGWVIMIFHHENSLAAKTSQSISAMYLIDRIGFKVLDPMTFRFCYSNPAHENCHSDHNNITNEKPATVKLTMAVEALKEEPAPWKALTDEEGDVLLVTLDELVWPASAACCEAEALAAAAAWDAWTATAGFTATGFATASFALPGALLSGVLFTVAELAAAWLALPGALLL